MNLQWWAWLHGPSALSAPACNDGGAREKARDRRQRERDYAARHTEVYRAVDVNKLFTVSILFLFPPPFARDRTGLGWSGEKISGDTQN